MGLGLAISTDFMRACEASRRWRRLRLRWCGAAALPPELIAASPREENISSLASFARTLASVFRDLALQDHLQVGLPDSSVQTCLLLADGLPQEAAACRNYLLGRLADLLDVKPEDSWLSYKAMTNPLPGPQYIVLCALSANKVIQQYERALAESRIRYSGFAPSSVLLFNLFRRQLLGPPEVPVLLVNATDEALTTIITVDGCPVFWRTRAPGEPGNGGRAPADDPREELLGDVAEAIVYGEARLGTETPATVLVTGPLARQPGFMGWLAGQVGLPAAFLDAGQLVEREARGVAAEGWDRWAPALGAAAQP